MSSVEKISQRPISENGCFKSDVISIIMVALATIVLIGATLAFLALKGVPLRPLNSLPNLLGKAGILAWFYSSMAAFALSLIFYTFLQCRKKGTTQNENAVLPESDQKKEPFPSEIFETVNDYKAFIESISEGEFVINHVGEKYYLFTRLGYDSFVTEQELKKTLNQEYSDFLNSEEVKSAFSNCPVPSVSSNMYVPFNFYVGKVEFHGVHFKKKGDSEVCYYYARGDFHKIQKWIQVNLRGLSLDITWVQKHAPDLATTASSIALLKENEARELEVELNHPYIKKVYGFCYQKTNTFVLCFLSSKESSEAMQKFTNKQKLEKLVEGVIKSYCISEIFEKKGDFYWPIKVEESGVARLILLYLNDKGGISYEQMILKADTTSFEKDSFFQQYSSLCKRNTKDLVENSTYYPESLSKYLMQADNLIKNREVVLSNMQEYDCLIFKEMWPRISSRYPEIFPVILKVNGKIEYRAYKSSLERDSELKSYNCVTVEE